MRDAEGRFKNDSCAQKEYLFHFEKASFHFEND